MKSCHFFKRLIFYSFSTFGGGAQIGAEIIINLFFFCAKASPHRIMVERFDKYCNIANSHELRALNEFLSSRHYKVCDMGRQEKER